MPRQGKSPNCTTCDTYLRVYVERTAGTPDKQAPFMRDMGKNPYSPDEARVAKFFFDKGVGGGDDPIGALLASHEYLVAERNLLRATVAGLRGKHEA